MEDRPRRQRSQCFQAKTVLAVYQLCAWTHPHCAYFLKNIPILCLCFSRRSQLCRRWHDQMKDNRIVGHRQRRPAGQLTSDVSSLGGVEQLTVTASLWLELNGNVPSHLEALSSCWHGLTQCVFFLFEEVSSWVAFFFFPSSASHGSVRGGCVQRS